LATEWGRARVRGLEREWEEASAMTWAEELAPGRAVVLGQGLGQELEQELGQALGLALEMELVLA